MQMKKTSIGWASKRFIGFGGLLSILLRENCFFLLLKMMQLVKDVSCIGKLPASYFLDLRAKLKHRRALAKQTESALALEIP
jgi:hypothetical protein